MIISHQNRFVLMAPWKCASTTCHETLRHLNESPYSRFFAFNAVLNRVVHQHLTLGDFLALPESRLGYRVAAFVRNPYDRAYSAFLQIQRDALDQPKRDYEPAWVRELVCDQIAQNMAKIINAGYDFDRWINGLSEAEVYGAGRNINFLLHPMHYWTHVDGKPYANFVGKIEVFREDFDRFCREFQISVPEIKLGNVSEKLGGSGTPRYRYVERMSDATIERVNCLFRDDFEIFGYPMVAPRPVDYHVRQD